MLSSKKINRREFVVSTSVAAIGAATVAKGEGNSSAEVIPQAFRSPSGSIIPYAQSQLMQQGPQRTFTKDHLSEIAFPLGGIGTGTVSLGGRGQLTDWEIFNRPAKGRVLPFSFVALWTREQGGAATVKVIEAPPEPPYRGAHGYTRT